MKRQEIVLSYPKTYPNPFSLSAEHDMLGRSPDVRSQSKSVASFAGIVLECSMSRTTTRAVLLIIPLVSACGNPAEYKRQPSRVQDVPLSPSIVVENSQMRHGFDALEVVLDFLVIASDTFQWTDASESPFTWQLQESGRGQLLTRYEGTKGAFLDVSDIGDAVHLESDLTVDVEATPNVLLEMKGRSLDSRGGGNENTQEFFFKTGIFEEWSEFVMYDMGGSSANPSGPDRACGGDEQTPYNRDQLSTRSRVQRTQCWDGYSNAPADWSVGSTKSMLVDFADGTAQAYLDHVLVAHLDQEMGETIRSLQSPVVWVKNVDKGGGEDLLIDSITLYDTSVQETDGYVVARVPVESDQEEVLVQLLGVLPSGSSVIIELSNSSDGPYVAQTDPFKLTAEASHLFIKVLVDSTLDPSGLSLTGLRLEYYR